MKWFFKLIISLCISFVILNIFSFFYYNVPSRTQDVDNATEYKWPANSFYSRLTEGISFGTVNNDGYNNELDYNSDTIINNLLMGSSQVEGFNVFKDDTIASMLNRMTNTYTYNIGISEHTLPICISNLDNSLSKYKPTDNVIIETMTVSFYEDQLYDAINKQVSLETYSSGIIDYLQNFKYLKLAYYQLGNIKKGNDISEPRSVNNEMMLNDLLSYAKEVSDKYGVNLIIVFHPSLTIDNSGNIYVNYNENDMDIFSKVCSSNDIKFINMEDDFINRYNETYELPHGFVNTLPGVGHLNAVGNELIANKLKEEIE